MRKILRLFIALFCIFFAFRAMPGSVGPLLRSWGRRAADTLGEATLLIAETIDGLGGGKDSPAQALDRDTPQSGAMGTTAARGGKDSPAQGLDRDTPQSGATGTTAARGGKDPAGRDAGEDHALEEERPAKSADAARDGNPEADYFYYYYTRISREERLLYDAMLALARNALAAGAGASGADGGSQSLSGTGGTNRSAGEDSAWPGISAQGPGTDPADFEESRLLDVDPSSEAFAESYTRAYNALVNDHPELFWIAQGEARYTCKYYILPSFGGKYKVVLSLALGRGEEGEGPGVAAQGDASAPESGAIPFHLPEATPYLRRFAEETARLRDAADALLAQADLSLSDAEIALRLHDLVIDTAWYNTAAGPDDYAHTAYGALVEDSNGNPGGALCDGYALAYEYLLQRAGIPSTMVCGYAGASDEDAEKHAWNLILLDGDWYEVDATWDDLDFLLSPSDEGYDLLLEALSDEGYMQKIRHYMWGRTTEEIRSFTPGDEYTYSSYRGWVTLLQPSVHIRFTEEESAATRDYVTPLAPLAEGTWYSYETLAQDD